MLTREEHRKTSQRVTEEISTMYERLPLKVKKYILFNTVYMFLLEE